MLDRILPQAVRVRLAGRPTLQRIINNTGWLFADKIIRMGVGLFVVGWVARYLGPGQFGVLNYATAFVALFTPLAALGLDSIVVRDIVREPGAAEDILGTAFGSKLLAGLATAALTVGVIYVIKPGDTVMVTMVAILSLTMIFNSMDVIDFWFQSRVQSRSTVIARNSAFIMAALITVGLVFVKGPLIAFAGIRTLEIALGAAGLATVYTMSGNSMRGWRISAPRLKQLLSDSWPLILAGMVIMIYMRIDQIMLGEMIGSDAVGQYSAAVRVSEVWYFIPTGLVISAFPAIVEAKRISEDLYKRRMQKLCNVLSLISYSLAIPMSFFSGHVINFIFGRQYAVAGSVLAIHIWAAVFVFLGIAKMSWINTEGLMKYTFISTSMGAVLNVLLNLFFIKRWGITGAAFATLISQFFSSVGSNLLFKKTYPVFIIQMNSLFLLGWKKKTAQ
jgi:PST family polysaccharide transporter